MISFWEGFSNSCSFVTRFSWLFQMLCVSFFPFIYVKVFLACWVLHDCFFSPSSLVHQLILWIPFFSEFSWLRRSLSLPSCIRFLYICSVCLVTMYCFGLCLCWSIFLSPFLLEDHFDVYRDLGWKLLLLSGLEA